MLALRDWQQHLQRAILDGDASADLQRAIRRHGVIAQQRIGIYRDAYFLRLAEALASNYPAIALYLSETAGESVGETGRESLGATDFNAMAQAYATAYPSRHASIRWFGDRLDVFLRSQAPWSSNPVLHELARFEWALRHTVDAADAPVLTFEALQALPPEHWPDLLLTLQPAVTLLHLDWNTPAVWRCLVDQQPLPVPQPGAQHWLVYRRQDLMAMWRSAMPEEARLLLSISNGITFADLCDVMAEHETQPETIPAQAAALLRQWVSAGLLVDTLRAPVCPTSGN
jgi:hypothetical protein